MDVHRLFRPNEPEAPRARTPKIPEDLLEYLEQRYRVEIPDPSTGREDFLVRSAKAQLVRELRALKEDVQL